MQLDCVSNKHVRFFYELLSLKANNRSIPILGFYIDKQKVPAALPKNLKLPINEPQRT